MVSPANILLVEDNPDDAEAMMRGLRRNRCLNPVHWCQSGQDALDYLYRAGRFAGRPASDNPDLILLDLNMPGLDGRDVLKALKRDPALHCIPVIILTTSRDEHDVMRCYDIGANTYVQKPVSLMGLTEALARMQDYWFGLAILPTQPMPQGSTMPI
jgi:CheY-like chemotaxis protein